MTIILMMEWRVGCHSLRLLGSILRLTMATRIRAKYIFGRTNTNRHVRRGHQKSVADRGADVTSIGQDSRIWRWIRCSNVLKKQEPDVDPIFKSSHKLLQGFGTWDVEVHSRLDCSIKRWGSTSGSSMNNFLGRSPKEWMVLPC